MWLCLAWWLFRLTVGGVFECLEGMIADVWRTVLPKLERGRNCIVAFVCNQGRHRSVCCSELASVFYVAHIIAFHVRRRLCLAGDSKNPRAFRNASKLHAIL